MGAANMSPLGRPGLSFWQLRLKHLILANVVMFVLAAIFYGLQGDFYELAKEGRIPTWFSVLQLLAIAYTSYRIYLDRRADSNENGGYRLWLIMAVGFLFLAIDEKTLIHESLDKDIHAFFSIRETALTDSIDDAIVLLYGIIGIAVLYGFRQEIYRFRVLIPFLAGGFLLFLVMGVVDVLTNRATTLQPFMESLHAAELLNKRLAVAEECLKLFSEAIFLAGFLACRRNQPT